MNSSSILTSIALIALSCTFSGCGSSTKFTNTNERSVGQQLTDLSQARQQGIITEREYERLKKAIIREHD